MILRCAIIDDEPLAVELMRSYVRKTPFLQSVWEAGSASAAYGLLKDNPVDLIFCDIQMPGLNGIEFSRMIPESCRVIFSTAFSQYALDGFRVNALDYLLKPVSYEDFLTAARKALDWFELKSAARPQAGEAGQDAAPQYLFVKSEYRQLRIELDRILYIEGLKDYVKIHVEGEDDPVLSLMSMKQLEETLPASRFARVHRSYIVQLSKIRTIERNRIIFGNAAIPVSDNYKEEFYRLLTEKSIRLK